MYTCVVPARELKTNEIADERAMTTFGRNNRAVITIIIIIIYRRTSVITTAVSRAFPPSRYVRSFVLYL